MFPLLLEIQSFAEAYPDGGANELILYICDYSIYIGAIVWPFAIGSNILRIFLLQ